MCVPLASSATSYARHNQVDMVASPDLWLERGSPCDPELVKEGPRIGISSAGEKWAKAPLRFHLADCTHVSKPRT